MTARARRCTGLTPSRCVWHGWHGASTAQHGKLCNVRRPLLCMQLFFALLSTGSLQGLPEVWAQDGETGFGAGAFSLDGKFPMVEENIHLIKGLFSDSIPPFLRLQARPSRHHSAC